MRSAQFCADGGGPLTACLHLAGTYGRATAAELSADALAAATRAKAAGAVHLHRAAAELEQHPAFVHFGSVATTFAGHGLGGYAAGNEFLEWFATLPARAPPSRALHCVGCVGRRRHLGARRDPRHGVLARALPLRHGIGALRALLGGAAPAPTTTSASARARRRDPPAVRRRRSAAAEATRCVFYAPDQLPSLDAIAAGAIPICVPKDAAHRRRQRRRDALRTLPLPESDQAGGRRRRAATATATATTRRAPRRCSRRRTASCGACSAACARRAASRPPPPTMSSSSSVCRR